MQLKEVKDFLEGSELPKSVRLEPAEVCFDVPKLVRNHLSALENNSGNRTFLPYYQRLMKIIEVIKV